MTDEELQEDTELIEMKRYSKKEENNDRHAILDNVGKSRFKQFKIEVTDLRTGETYEVKRMKQ